MQRFASIRGRRVLVDYISAISSEVDYISAIASEDKESPERRAAHARISLAGRVLLNNHRRERPHWSFINQQIYGTEPLTSGL